MPKPKPGRDDPSVQNFMKLRCPCGGDVTLGTGSVSNAPALGHTLPTCQRFDSAHPADFLGWLRANHVPHPDDQAGPLPAAWGGDN